MNEDRKPHSRKKTVGTGSAGVGKGDIFGSGSGPVGSGGRTSGSSSPRSQNGAAPVRGLPFKLNLKTIIIIAALVIVAFIVLKSCGGDLLSGLGGSSGQGSGSDMTDTSASYDKPDRSVSSLARAKRVTPVGGGNDIVNIMIYMCGTDLESKYGMATSDLNEMMKAKISDKVNVIVMTGGCSKWKTGTISNKYNQIYKVETGKLVRLEENFGTSSMTDPGNLTKFIKYCNSNFGNATRNMLIFWDHGGGTVSGYGYDEKNPNASSMTLTKISQALDNAKCDFEIIGFDACLMATLETALVCSEHADYLLASEETEPGTGWYYTNWLNELSKDTSISAIDLTETVIDDFVSSSVSASPNAGVTLSLIDLAELDGTVPDSFNKFSSSTVKLIESDNYKQVSKARADVRQFAKQSGINQVDMIDLAGRIGTSESKALAKVLKSCVKYNKTTLSNSYGISVYFPYENTSSVKTVVASYEALDIDDEYTKCIKSFASLEYGGQIAGAASQMSLGSIGGDLLGSLISSYTSSGSSTSPLTSLLGSFIGGGSSGSSSSAGLSLDPQMIVSLLSSFSGRSMPAEYDWVDTKLIAEKADMIASNFVDPSRITVTEKNGKKVLSLTDAEWNCIDTVELSVFVRDQDGYIDLGLDNTFEWFDDNSVLLDFDGTWLTLNGNTCAYYLVSDTKKSDGTYVTEGRIPALLNGTPVNLRVLFNGDDDGVITGAAPMYEDETSVEAKGEIQINKGDEIELLCDYYGMDGSYKASYKLGSSFTVPKSGLRLENLKLDITDADVMYRITDIYGNRFWLPV